MDRYVLAQRNFDKKLSGRIKTLVLSFQNLVAILFVPHAIL